MRKPRHYRGGYCDDEPFLMPVRDVFVVSGKGVAVCGVPERGNVGIGEVVEVTCPGVHPLETKVQGIEFFRYDVDPGYDTIGLLVDIPLEQASSKGFISAPKVLMCARKFHVELECIQAEAWPRVPARARRLGAADGFILESGMTFGFYWPRSPVKGSVCIADGREIVLPGEKVSAEIEAENEQYLAVGLKFDVVLGDAIVGQGTVTGVAVED